MGKRMRHSSDSSLAKEKALLDSDRISSLPDDILVNIISRLDLREAARTSLLSSRWKYLWTFTTLLNFERCLAVSLSDQYKSSDLDELRSKYISWVNRVLELHRGSWLNYFNIDFDFDYSHETTITDWIYQAIAKKVQKFAVDLSPCSIRDEKQCTFPHITFPYISGLRCLTSLSLVRVGITMENLEFFIYYCPLLERLRVENSRGLSGALKLVGSSIQLKYLDIRYCFSITDIEISAAPSLLSFKYLGRQIKLNIENVPLLVDVSIGAYVSIGGWLYRDRLQNLIDPIKSYLAQLETLALGLNLDQENIPSLCELSKLKHLTFGVCGSDSKSLVQLTDIINACPFLYKFTLEFERMGKKRRRKLNEFPRCSHQHLKVLELIGFVGSPIELEFAFYILKNAINLEKIIVNPSEFEETKKKLADLKERVPQGVEFVLL